MSTIKTRCAFLFKFSGDVVAATDAAAIEARLYIVHGLMSLHVFACGVGGFVPLFVEALDDHFFSYVQIWFSLNYVEYFTFCFFVRVHSVWVFSVAPNRTSIVLGVPSSIGFKNFCHVGG